MHVPRFKLYCILKFYTPNLSPVIKVSRTKHLHNDSGVFKSALGRNIFVRESAMLHESSEISTAIDFRNTHKVMKIALNIALVQFRSDTEFTATVFRVRTAVNACNLPVLEVSLFLYCFTYIHMYTYMFYPIYYKIGYLWHARQFGEIEFFYMGITQ